MNEEQDIRSEDKKELSPESNTANHYSETETLEVHHHVPTGAEQNASISPMF